MLDLSYLGWRTYLVILLLLLCISLLLNCRNSIESRDDKVNMQNSASENEKLSVTNSMLNEKSEKKEIAFESKNNSKKMIVIIGAIELKTDGLGMAREWSSDKKDDEVIDLGMKFDVLNCAGYVGQARVIKELKGYWELEFIKESIRPDVEQAVKQCKRDIIEIEDNILASNGAYAVYSSKPERKNIRLTKQPTEKDLKAIYESLSPEQKRWRATLNRDHKPETISTLENNSDWADSDGDGKIDLITIGGTCDETAGGELICMKVLHYQNGKWKQVARITPA